MEIIKGIEYGLFMYNDKAFVGYRVYTNKEVIGVYVTYSDILDYDVLMQKDNIHANFIGATIIDFEMKDSEVFVSDADNEFTEVYFHTDRGDFYLTARSSNNHSLLIEWEDFEYFKSC
jgi:hypothetical protein